MKHITLGWWRGDEGEDEGNPFRDYKLCLDSVRIKLSKDINLFIDTVNLHDAMVIEMNYQAAGRSFDVLLNVSYPSPGGPSAEEYHLTRLIYRDVAGFRSTTAAEKKMGGPGGYGHLLADEFELIDQQLIEHRWLFSSSIEIQIQFHELQWARLD